MTTMYVVMADQKPAHPHGPRFRELRGSRTQYEIAEATGVKPASVSLWERGGAITRPNAQAYDDALGADGEVMSLLGYTAPSGAIFTTIVEKLDRILDLLENKPKQRRHERDDTPRAMPRPALRGPHRP